MLAKRAPTTVHASWPQARHLAAAALAWSLLVVYGSLTPFQYEPMEWSKAAAILRWIAVNPPQRAPRGDWITNLWLFVPLGFAALGALLLDRDGVVRRGVSVGLVLAGGLLLSLGVEAAQLWFPPRHPAKADVVAQTIGNAIGMGVWVFAGQALCDWSRSHWRGPRGGRVLWVLGVYAAGLLVYSLLPLDLTIRPGDLWDKYKEGRIILVPFSRWEGNVASLYGALSDAAIYLPIGILTAIWTPYAARRWFRWLFGLAIVCLIELAQVLVRSRYSDVTDVILGWAGVTLGFWVAASWTTGGASLGAPQKALRAACLMAFVLLLLAVYLQPFHWLGDQELALARLRGMLRVPLEALRQGDLLGMISNVLRKLLLFGVLGWLAVETAAAMAIAKRGGGKLAVGILAGLAAAATIEVLQAWSPPHVPDLTDVFWGAAGGGLGAYVARFLEEDPWAPG